MLIIKCLIIILLSIFLFYLNGMLAKRAVKVSMNRGETLLMGFFVYYGLFQIVALPLIFMQKPLSLLARVWLILLVVLFGVGIFFIIKKPEIRLKLKVENKFLVGVVILLLLMQLYYMVTNEYSGWDTAYYIGNMNTSVFTDSMYIYDGSSGIKAAYLNLRYALSAFYMQGAVWCLWLDLPPLIYCRYVIPVIGWVLSNLIVYKVGERTVGKYEKKYSYLFCGFAALINFNFYSIYTTSDFLLRRSAEAKSYCANIIIPTIFLIAIAMWDDWKEKKYWIFLLVISFSANAISFSSLVLLPIILTVICAAIFWVYKDRLILKRYFLCILIPVFYCVVYFLYAKGFIKVVIR